ncbi:MAG: phenylalanine--tRNA ligase subunit beta [SAR324 cluster bacterium]|nr:phenylalanine--tRNA ligase subunit beta [SAR324 cluster bacterium]
MKLSINWVKEFVSIPTNITPDELVAAITLSTCEVEGQEFYGSNLSQITVAEVVKIEQHPQADKLSLVTVNKGTEEEQVVCGANNFKIADKVAFAGLGVKISEDFTISKAKIRGVESCGMLCAEDELGFSDDHDGLMILDTDAIVGMPLSEIYPDHMDLVLEIDNKSITHRPDLWGHYGFAREIAAIYHQELEPYSPKPLAIGSGEPALEVEILNSELTPRYTGLGLNGIQIGPSPKMIQHRLFRVGLRPINNAVDVTNYVMVELGEPMHAFDRATIAGSKLVIGLAKVGEKLETLVGKTAEFTANDLIISDTKKPIVVAGVVGGLNSGVTDATTEIFLEAANWEPVSVRKTSVQIGLRTDSSQRFEKSLDAELTVPAIWRAVELLKETCPDLTTTGGLFDHYPEPAQIPPIEISTNFINRRLGTDLSPEKITDILTRLEFKVSASAESVTGSVYPLKVTPPSFRATKDIKIPEDLVEEVGRIYGYTNITPQSPKFAIVRPTVNPWIQMERTIQSNLVDQGLFEIYCYPLTDEQKESKFGCNPKGVMRLLNPVSDTHKQMRTSMLPHFVERVYNCQKDALGFGLFEIGRVYNKIESEGKTTVVEKNHMILAISTEKSKEVGSAFYQLKATLISLFNGLQLDGYSLAPKVNLESFQHKNIQAEFLKEDQSFGELYQFSPAFAASANLKGEVAIAKIDLDKLFKFDKSEYRYSEPFKYPAVHFELSIVVPKQVTFGQIKAELEGASSKVQFISFVGVFALENDQKSLSVQIEFRDHEKTLDPEEIKNLQDLMIATIEKSGFHLR